VQRRRRKARRGSDDAVEHEQLAIAFAEHIRDRDGIVSETGRHDVETAQHR
jgi:hypothetical protein